MGERTGGSDARRARAPSARRTRGARRALGVASCAVAFAVASAVVPSVATAAPPGASLGAHGLGRAFDACRAPSTAQMAVWRAASPYAIANIYIGGINRGCSQPNLDAAWVRTVTHAGWRLIPTYVGLQAPCEAAPDLKMTSASQGTASAADAASIAAALGLYAGTPIYYDMEAYGRTGPCIALATAYLDAWTRELHRRGYRSGVYSSASSGITDLVYRYTNPAFASPDDVWIAHWDGVMTDQDPYVPSSYWAGHRIRQYAANINEQYGGVTINIDRDFVNGDVAGQPPFLSGPPVSVNGPYIPVPGDFDGDGRADILWYQPGAAPDVVTRSIGGGRFAVVPANNGGTYQPVVGDFNGDGRSDIFWYAPGVARDWVWLGSSGTPMFTSVAAPNVVSVYTPIVGDFDGDGRSDIFWYAPGVARDWLWRGSSGTPMFTTLAAPNVGASYVPVPGDFDGDGRTDILWYGVGAQADYLWRGTSTTAAFTRGPSVGVPGQWYPVIGDFDGDGRTDILWDGAGVTPDVLARGTATGFAHGQPVSVTGLDLPIVGDYNGDGGDDVMWFSPTGPDRLWFGN